MNTKVGVRILRLRDSRNSRKQGVGSCLTSVLKGKIEDLLKLVRIWLISCDSHQVSANWANFAIFAVRSWGTLKEQGLGEISDNHVVSRRSPLLLAN